MTAADPGCPLTARWPNHAPYALQGCTCDPRPREPADRREPGDPELFARTAPRWNCVDYPDGPHYLSGGACAWCGRTRAEIRRRDVNHPDTGSDPA